MKSEAPYRPMPQDSLEDLSLLGGTSPTGDRAYEFEGNQVQRKARAWRVLVFFASFQAILNVMFIGIGAALYVRRGANNPIFPEKFYSPVNHLIEYKTVVFHEGFGKDISQYQQEPSPEVDQAWDDLYQFGTSRLTRDEAMRLENATYRIPGDEDHYVVQLDVFHQLHCLNLLRKSLYREYYSKEPHLDTQHLSHCVENIRQTLMCSADVTPLVWQWVERVQQVRIMGNVIHTCRDWDKIREWGLERRLDHDIDFTGFH
ncbi:hypothetical protein CVT24_004090 [Panaeolus cyanescens]|uniref:Tat pathway signal sequence n=1 Tax=Panaeolus cyanescens TaxID=181874 RepID=A0A409Y645_9AGAR|nr:hypothetical protein CVT24_004090 [Panaeolus cyanescens]